MMYIGIDLGGTNIAAALVDETYCIAARKSIPTRAQRPALEIIADMAALAKELMMENNLTVGDIAWVGIGVPGSVDSKNGVVIYCCNIGFDNTPVAALFREYLDVPVFLGNDADCAALAEVYAGAAKGVDNAILITLGTGLGGGIIINRQIYNGFNGCGGELGHVVIVKDGHPCPCGRKGCWEQYSSATALIRMTAEALEGDRDRTSAMWKRIGNDLTCVSGRTAFEAARAGDPLGLAVVEAYASYLACGIVSMINIFQPEVFCIGGGISNEGPYLLDTLVEKVKKEVYTRGDRQTLLRFAALKNDAGIVGAALLGK